MPKVLYFPNAKPPRHPDGATVHVFGVKYTNPACRMHCEVLEWCRAEFGEPGEDFTTAARWTHGKLFVHIVNDNDAFAFRLRWC